MKFLFIDDNAEYLRSIGAALKKSGDVVIAECHSVGEAFAAIRRHRPDVLFLDHHLTDYGEEGYEIARTALANHIKVYSTTSNDRVAGTYAEMGIAHISKVSPLGDFRKIITQHSAA